MHKINKRRKKNYEVNDSLICAHARIYSTAAATFSNRTEVTAVAGAYFFLSKHFTSIFNSLRFTRCFHNEEMINDLAAGGRATTLEQQQKRKKN